MRPGYEPTRRNRNIGTASRGHGRDNRMTIPEICHAERIWWEQLASYEVETLTVAGRDLTFVVEATRKDCVHSCSIGDICTILACIPATDWDGLGAIILRQSKRKEWLIAPSWGRLAFSADIGKPGKPNIYSGPAIILEAVDPVERRTWGKHLSPVDLAELDRLRDDGHRVQEEGKRFSLVSTLEASRATQLYRTLLHEIGHWVDWLERVERPSRANSESYEALADKYFSRAGDERESFAHRYADAMRSRLIKAGVIPFSQS